MVISLSSSIQQWRHSAQKNRGVEGVPVGLRLPTPKTVSSIKVTGLEPDREMTNCQTSVSGKYMDA